MVFDGILFFNWSGIITKGKLHRFCRFEDSLRALPGTRTFEEAIEKLKQYSGTQFDPEYVEPFVDMIHEMYLTKKKAVLYRHLP